MAPKKRKADGKGEGEGEVVGRKGGGWDWRMIDSVIVGPSKVSGKPKIASFDMDDTLVKTKSGGPFPKNADDWQFWAPSVPERLKELAGQGYKIVIFTNQKGIQVGKTNPEHIKQKIEKIAEQSGVEIQAFIATTDDKYRKPGVKLWDLLAANNEGIQISRKDSFFCGDAAGRKLPHRKDFTDTDIKFAHNLGVRFEVPETTFLKEPMKPIPIEGLDPKLIPSEGPLFEGLKSNLF